MILKLNHLHGKEASASAQDVIGTLYSLLEEGHIDQNQFVRLQIELDWIQYRQNFREPVIAICGSSTPGWTAVHHGHPHRLPSGSARLLARTALTGDCSASLDAREQDSDRLPLEEFQSPRTSIV